MKLPDPNAVALLKSILDAQAAPSITSPGIYSLKPILHPAIFYDDAAGTFNYTLTGTGEDYVGRYDNVPAFVGTNGILLQTRATTPAAMDVVQARKCVPANKLPIISLRALWKYPAAGPTNVRVRFSINHSLGTQYHEAQVQFCAYAPYAQFLKKTNGTWALSDIPGWVVAGGDDRWQDVTLRVNTETGCYVSIEFNGQTYSIPTEPTRLYTGSNIGPTLEIALWLQIIEALQGTAHFAQILLTAEEA